jgi:cellulose biosynthesis protein BcsQ
VGKTTLVANLGAELALNFGAKVLVVDADPQCNLTQYVLYEDEAIDTYSSNDPASVYSVIRPLSLGKGYGTDLPLRKSEAFGFDLIIGDPRLALQEDLLANDWRDARGGGMRGIRTTFVFVDLVSKAKELKYDFVFFDMGPSLGAINRAVLLAMDFFVVPMTIDVFSSWAIRNIGTTVTIWQKELKTGISLAEDPAELESIARTGSIKFLGYVTQQHRERAEEEVASIIVESDEASEGRRRRIVQAYEEISDKFPEQISESLGSFLDSAKIDPFLGNVRHLGSLAPKSQSQHSPMISVRGTGRFVQSRKQAREIYRAIATRYLQNLNNFSR